MSFPQIFPSSLLRIALRTIGLCLCILPRQASAAGQSVFLGDADTVRAELQVGASGKAALAFRFADGKTQEIAGTVKADEMKRTVEKDGKKVQAGTPMPDAFIEFKGAELIFKNHVRPNLARYTEKQREELVATWDTLPSAAQHWSPVEVRALDAGAEVWMEGRYCWRINGDSSWGRIYWEIEDAKGERWRSSKDSDGGDWGNQSAIDFDGWCFVTFPLPRESPMLHIEPGAGLGQWQGNSDGKLDYPLKFTGLYIETHRQSLNLTKMAPVKSRIRLQGLSVIE